MIPIFPSFCFRILVSTISTNANLELLFRANLYYVHHAVDSYQQANLLAASHHCNHFDKTLTIMHQAQCRVN